MPLIFSLTDIYLVVSKNEKLLSFLSNKQSTFVLLWNSIEMKNEGRYYEKTADKYGKILMLKDIVFTISSYHYD